MNIRFGKVKTLRSATETNLGIPGSSLGIQSILGSPGILGSNLDSPGIPGSKSRRGIPDIPGSTTVVQGSTPVVQGSTPVVQGSNLGWTARTRY